MPGKVNVHTQMMADFVEIFFQTFEASQEIDLGASTLRADEFALGPKVSVKAVLRPLEEFSKGKALEFQPLAFRRPDQVPVQVVIEGNHPVPRVADERKGKISSGGHLGRYFTNFFESQVLQVPCPGILSTNPPRLDGTVQQVPVLTQSVPAHLQGRFDAGAAGLGNMDKEAVEFI